MDHYAATGNSSSLWEKTTAHFTAFVLFFLFSTHLWLAALKKPLWGDETWGIGGTLRNSFGQLLMSGPVGEASPSPFPYIMEKLWLLPWKDAPQAYWDINLFFRILPVVYWALAAITIYYFVLLWLKEQVPNLRFISRILLATAATTFYHSGGFGTYYALEDRSYAPWILFSTLHFCFFITGLMRDLKRKEWINYGIISFVLIFTTYVSLAQIGTAFFIQLFSQWLRNSRKDFFKLARPYFIILVLCTALAVNYLLRVPTWNFKPLTWGFFWECVLDVVAKAWHNHGKESFFVMAPLIGILVPWLWRKRRGIAEIAIYSWAMIAVSMLFFLACILKGNLFASRYLIFLTPPATAVYFIALLALAHGISHLLRRAFPSFSQITAYSILLLWAIIEVGSRVPVYARAIHQDIPLLYAYRVGEKASSPICFEPLTRELLHPETKAAELNQICRAISLE